MDTEKAYNALLETASRRGIAVEAVISEIEQAITETIATATRNNDEILLEKWRKIPCVGERPSAIELVAYISSMVKDSVMEVI